VPDHPYALYRDHPQRIQPGTLVAISEFLVGLPFLYRWTREAGRFEIVGDRDTTDVFERAAILADLEDGAQQLLKVWFDREADAIDGWLESITLHCRALAGLYGHSRTAPGLVLTDLTINGEFMPFQTLFGISQVLKVAVCPPLYTGLYTPELLPNLLEGKSKYDGTSSMAGLVLQTEVETMSPEGVRGKLLYFNPTTDAAADQGSLSGDPGAGRDSREGAGSRAGAPAS
jgi:hypothetical protein